MSTASTKRPDLTGQRFGRLTAMSRAPDRNRQSCWNVACDCGGTRVSATYDLIHGANKSCGCIRREGLAHAPRMDLTGQRFGRLTVVSRAPDKGPFSRWNVVCDCGATFDTKTSSLQAGVTVSCGCWRREALAAQTAKGTVHGQTRRGAPRQPEYHAWANMKQRCSNPDDAAYSYYGGRGIRVCDAWQHDFAAFLAYVGPRPSPKHSLDRWPNNDGNYEPGNVRWATKSQQSGNTRRARRFAFDGRTQSLTEWAREFGTTLNVLARRLRSGRSLAEAFTELAQHSKARR